MTPGSYFTNNGVKLGRSVTPAANPAYPPHFYYIQLPSGMFHWFETEQQARQSQYWPSN